MRSWWMGLKVERLEFDSFSYVWSLGELCDWLRGVLCGHFCLSAPPSFLRLVLRVDRGCSRKSCTTTFSRLALAILDPRSYLLLFLANR